jgi:hypothetical protein
MNVNGEWSMVSGNPNVLPTGNLRRLIIIYCRQIIENHTDN